MTDAADGPGLVPQTVNEAAELAIRRPYVAVAIVGVVAGLAAMKYLETVAPKPWRLPPLGNLRAALHEWSKPAPDEAPGSSGSTALRAVT